MSEPGVIVTVIGAANGEATPFDGEYVASWNPHTPYGVCKVTTTTDKTRARVFPKVSDALEELRTVSKVEPRRPTDGKPNRPLTGLTVSIERLGS